ncbi:leucyl aminopeptidase family protein [Chthonobacter albigriseus]|uniref:leucyl aminopeptidase family protein n=1 Tax=Chthonobacter albigriseus TaxID=1683161 RepID=UPI003CC7CFF8
MPFLIAADTADESVPIHVVSEESLAATAAALPEGSRAWVEANGFKASAGSHVIVPGADGRLGSVLFGLGKTSSRARSPFLVGHLATALPPATYRLVTFEGDLDLSVLAFALGSYRFERYVKPRPNMPRLVLPSSIDATALERTVRAVFATRDLINTPANDLGTEELAAAAKSLGERHGAQVREIIGEDLLSANFPLVYAVGAASDRLPRLVDFTWGDENHEKVTLVGKGVVFDTGGLNIKPDNSMLLMKKDMGGAANVLGLAQMIMEAGLRVRLRVIVPIVENAISGRAFRPGDVFRSRKGLTVEIGNTDAEGRLILADALALADEEAPALLVDMATLTGAARVALGPDLPPIYTHDDRLADDLAVAAMEVNDPSWRLPLWPAYDSMLSSKVADVNHVTTGGMAGSITAALFLGRFVEKAASWLHADIFGWVPSAKPGQPEGGEAQVIRSLFALLEKRYG